MHADGPVRRQPDERQGQALGWLSGLALLVVPWIAAGVLATAGTLVRPDGWEAERTFPWLVLAVLGIGLAAVVYGSVRNRGFRRGALPGAAVAVSVMAAGLLLVRAVQT